MRPTNEEPIEVSELARYLASKDLRDTAQLAVIKDTHSTYWLKTSGRPVELSNKPIGDVEVSLLHSDVIPRWAIAQLLCEQLNPDHEVEGDYMDLRPVPDRCIRGCAPSTSTEQPWAQSDNVLASHAQLSDFDRYSLVTNADYAASFRRWLSKLETQDEKIRGSVGDTLQLQRAKELPTCPQPIYPLQPLPQDTLDYISKIQRPLIATANLSTSDMLHFTITKVFEAQDSTLSKASVYLGTLSNGPDGDTTGPIFCLKVFRDDLDQVTNFAPARFRRAIASLGTLEERVSHDVTVYERLAHLQGSIVPSFHGSYEVSFDTSMSASFLIHIT